MCFVLGGWVGDGEAQAEAGALFRSENHREKGEATKRGKHTGRGGGEEGRGRRPNTESKANQHNGTRGKPKTAAAAAAPAGEGTENWGPFLAKKETPSAQQGGGGSAEAGRTTSLLSTSLLITPC